ncbi:MAG TPA: penicillin-binding transpeptidase domain-containing protein [Candidatus Paceibacterota bacterium]
MFRRRHRVREIAPEEIFLDSSNLPAMEASQFEGRVERPVPRRSIFGVGVIFMLVAIIFGARAFDLGVARGASFAQTSRDNTLESWPLFPLRGLVYDRAGVALAWNEAPLDTAIFNGATTTSVAVGVGTTTPYALRRYIEEPGFSVLLGFVKYPRQDKAGAWWRDTYNGMSGLELAFDEALAGQNGAVMIETDAHHRLVRHNITTPAENGSDFLLSIDADVQGHLYRILAAHAQKQHFVGGAAVIMDVHTGELLAITSFPEYDNQAFTDGVVAAVRSASQSPATPLLDRAISGLYAPGSIVKPMFAAAALNEGIISPERQILSTGAITIPNPYDPDNPSIYRDWRVHGWVDMRTALAVSSDEYFYTIGGGYGGQQGLGIERINQYAARFGFGTKTGIALLGEKEGVVPSIAWKEENFPGDPWRLGNTYHTAIGQYGFQITPIQAAVYIASIANGGKLLTPQLTASSTPRFTMVDIPDQYLQIAREGMRMAVTSPRDDATVKALNIGGIALAAKTGTAQIGAHNEWMNSWSVGFWPAENPRFAYAVVLERAPAGTASGAAPGLLPFFQWLISAHPEYVN